MTCGPAPPLEFDGFFFLEVSVGKEKEEALLHQHGLKPSNLIVGRALLVGLDF